MSKVYLAEKEQLDAVTKRVTDLESDVITAIVDQYGNQQPRVGDGHTVQVTLGRGGGDAEVGAMTCTIQVTPGTTTYSVNGVTPSMVVAESTIEDGVQGNDWKIVTDQNSVRVEGEILKNGTVKLVLVACFLLV